MELAIKMAPLTPNHHFYMDQGTYARVRLVFMAIGRKLVENKVFVQPDDIFFLKYEELRIIAADPSAFDSRKLIKERRTAREKAYSVRPRLWIGTISEWSLYGEPYKTNWGWPDIYTQADEMANQPQGTIKGLGASAGVVEGVARFVESPEEFNQVKKGEILVCKMTNPAWVVVFTKIGGLVTDAGGALSHPAVVSREFGIPAWSGPASPPSESRPGNVSVSTAQPGLSRSLDSACGENSLLYKAPYLTITIAPSPPSFRQPKRWTGAWHVSSFSIPN